MSPHVRTPLLFTAKELSFFRDISRKIIENLDLDSVLQSIVEKAPLFLKSDGSVLRLLNEKEDLLEVVKKYNVGRAFRRALKPGEGTAGLVLKEERAAIIPDISKDPHFLMKEDARKEGFSSAICVPLRTKGKAIGTLTVQSRKRRRYGEKDIFFLSALADQAALAIENARVYEKLKKSEEKYRTIIETIVDPYFEADIAGNLTFVNESLCKTLGYSRSELVDMNYRDYTDRENARKVYQAFNRVYTTGEPCRELVYEIITKDGAKRYLEAYVTLILNLKGEKIGFRGIARDITERRHLLMRTVKAEESYQKLFETVNDAILLLNREGYCTIFNHLFCRMTGYSEEEIRNLHFSKLIHPEDLPMMVEDHQKVMQGEPALERYTFRVIHKEGKTIYVEGNFHRVKEDDQIIGTLGVLRDMTEKIRLEQELRGLSITDDLTGLFNQRHFYRELEKEMERSKRQGTPLCLLLFDLDDFKAYNDTHGHLEGDKILKESAQAALEAIRKIDSAYRYGGDEFTVILPGAGEEEGALVGERLRKSCEKNPLLQGITLSIGLVEFNPQQDLPTFIKCADDSMYNAKKMGGNRVFVFPKEIREVMGG